jgi:hypothetical protein
MIGEEARALSPSPPLASSTKLLPGPSPPCQVFSEGGRLGDLWIFAGFGKPWYNLTLATVAWVFMSKHTSFRERNNFQLVLV